MIADVSQERNDFIFRVKQSKKSSRVPIGSHTNQPYLCDICKFTAAAAIPQPINAEMKALLSPIVASFVYTQQRTRFSRLVFHLSSSSCNNIYISSGGQHLDLSTSLSNSNCQPSQCLSSYLLLPSPLFPTSLPTNVEGQGYTTAPTNVRLQSLLSQM